MAWDANLVLKSSGAITANTNHTGIDLKGDAVAGRQDYNKAVLMEFRFFITALVVNDANETYDLKIEESTDDSTYTFLAAVRQLVTADGTFTGVNSSGKQFSCYAVPRKRYVRAVTTVGGTTPSITHSVRARGLDAVVADSESLSH